MKSQIAFCQVLFLFIFLDCSSQEFLITPPRLQFDGNQLMMNFDIVAKPVTDQFYVWVEIEKKSGEKIKARSFAGDVGENIKAGPGKKISWIPANDSVFLNEEVFVEVKAEKYVKTFNKGSMFLLSAIMPGLGQSKIKGKPYWVAGLLSYGALAGGMAIHSTGNKNYNAYLQDENPVTRKKTLEKAQGQLNTSSFLFVSGAAVWAANLIWVAAIPDKYQPLKNAKLTLEKAPWGNSTLIAIRVNF